MKKQFFLALFISASAALASADCSLNLEGDEWVVRNSAGFEIGRSLSKAAATEKKINAENANQCNVFVPPVVINPPIPRPPVVINPPIVVNPPVVINPPVVVQPPVVINPPILADWPAFFVSNLQGFCNDFDRSQFFAAKNFAFSGSGLDLSSQGATQWALNYNNTHACGTINEYQQRFSILRNFAFSGSGLDLSSQGAIDYALSKVEVTSVEAAQFEINVFARVKNFSFSGSGMDLTSTDSEQLALEWINDRCDHTNRLEAIISRFISEKNFAFSGAGLDLSSVESIRYAARSVAPMSRCGEKLIRYAR